MTQTCDPNRGDKIIVHVDPDLKDLVPGFLKNRRKDVKSLVAAVERSDYETIEALGHTMKGDGGGYGFHAITDIGGGLRRRHRTRISKRSESGSNSFLSTWRVWRSCTNRPAHRGTWALTLSSRVVNRPALQDA